MWKDLWDVLLLGVLTHTNADQSTYPPGIISCVNIGPAMNFYHSDFLGLWVELGLLGFVSVCVEEVPTEAYSL